MIIVGVSDESEKELSDYVAGKRPKYPIIRARGAMTKYGGKGYPSFFTIGPDGKIETLPDDYIPATSVLEAALESVEPLTALPLDPMFDELRKDWQKRRYARVDKKLEQLAADQSLDPALRKAIEKQRARLQARIERQARVIEDLADGPDYFDASQKLGRIRTEYAGLPPADAAKEVLSQFRRDKEIQSEIRTSKKLHDLLGRYKKLDDDRQRQKLITELRKFREKYSGTFAADLAQLKIAQVADLR